MRLFFALFLSVTVVFAQKPAKSEAVAKPETPAPVVPPAVRTDEPPRIIRVNVTNQGWDFFRPWGKRPPFSRRAIGAVLPGNRVLVTAELVGNANYIELEMPEGGGKTPATVE